MRAGKNFYPVGSRRIFFGAFPPTPSSFSRLGVRFRFCRVKRGSQEFRSKNVRAELYNSTTKKTALSCFLLVPGGRIELPTQGFSVLRSTTELPWQNFSIGVLRSTSPRHSWAGQAESRFCPPAGGQNRGSTILINQNRDYRQNIKNIVTKIRYWSS